MCFSASGLDPCLLQTHRAYRGQIIYLQVHLSDTNINVYLSYAHLNQTWLTTISEALLLQHLYCKRGKAVVHNPVNVPLPSQDKNPGTDQMRTGKWKVPSSLDYLDLYRSLLDCDRLKVISLHAHWVVLGGWVYPGFNDYFISHTNGWQLICNTPSAEGVLTWRLERRDDFDLYACRS